MRKLISTALLILGLTAAPATATEPAALTVTASETTVFNLTDLTALPVQQIVTSTIWTEGNIRFEGVSLHHLIHQIGIEAGQLQMVALNDYAVTIPVSDAVPDGPIIAYRMNGQAMTVRDKGPLWLIYPFDSNPEYQSQLYYARSIWQLARIRVLDDG